MFNYGKWGNKATTSSERKDTTDSFFSVSHKKDEVVNTLVARVNELENANILVGDIIKLKIVQASPADKGTLLPTQKACLDTASLLRGIKFAIYRQQPESEQGATPKPESEQPAPKLTR